jgi:hypothetical protein
MSLESKDEVSKEPDYAEVKALVARKSYQSIKQGSFESLAQYSERFRKTYRAYKESAVNVDVGEADQAMDFFHGLDAG